MSLLSDCSSEQLKEIVAKSTCYKDILQALGYAAVSGSVQQKLRERLRIENISTEHFNRPTGNQIVSRTEENTLCENSTASQKTVRKIFYENSDTPYLCSICGLLPEWNGKELTLILDHINGHNKDHRIENLRWVCPNCNSQLDTTGARNIKRLREEGFYEQVENKKEKQCSECGAQISNGSKTGLCVKCAHLVQRRSVRPDRETLKNLIRTTPFTTIGTQYGVSDNAIRKWCKAEGLPSSSLEIKKYSEEEWKNI